MSDISKKNTTIPGWPRVTHILTRDDTGDIIEITCVESEGCPNSNVCRPLKRCVNRV
jgi:hypothetical protein